MIPIAAEFMAETSDDIPLLLRPLATAPVGPATGAAPPTDPDRRRSELPPAIWLLLPLPTELPRPESPSSEPPPSPDADLPLREWWAFLLRRYMKPMAARAMTRTEAAAAMPAARPEPIFTGSP